MNTSNSILIESPYDALFTLSVDIQRWAMILPHYRWIKILRREGPTTYAEMAARHRGLPLWWRTIQTDLRSEKKILYHHIGGITRGMDVQWTFEDRSLSFDRPRWHVTIDHQFSPAWPLIGSSFANRVIGPYFVHEVAQKTLRRVKQIAEQEFQVLRSKCDVEHRTSNIEPHL